MREEQVELARQAVALLREAAKALLNTGGMLNADIAREATKVARRLEAVISSDR